MNSKRIRLLASIIIIGVLLTTTLFAFANKSEQTPVQAIDTSQIEITEEIQNIIKSQEPSEYEKNIMLYKSMLVKLDVHELCKSEIERLIKEDKALPDILIAYEFLYEQYGLISELEALVNQKNEQIDWEQIFISYKKENPEFVPQSFDFDYLDELTKKNGITNDDIMIADRVSQKAAKVFNEIIELKTTENTWKEINSSYGIINSQEVLPRVSVTQEQLKKYKAKGLAEDKIVQTLVLADRLEMNEEEAIIKATNGYTQEQILADVLEGRYY